MSRSWALVGLLSMVAALAPAAAQTLDAAPPKTWGRYTLNLSPRPAQGQTVPSQTLTVMDGSRVVQRVSAEFIGAEVQPLRPGGLPELVISAYSGGAHCCTTLLLYTQDGGRLENLGVLELGNYGVNFSDLNGDGTREIVMYSDNLAYYDWSFAASPALKTVLGWDGLRLADRTRFYPYVPAQEAERDLKEARSLLASDNPDSLKANVAGYFVNMILAGRGTEAESLIRGELLPRSALLQTWWPAHRSELIGTAYGQPESRLSIDTSATWPRAQDKTGSP